MVLYTRQIIRYTTFIQKYKTGIYFVWVLADVCAADDHVHKITSELGRRENFGKIQDRPHLT